MDKQITKEDPNYVYVKLIHEDPFNKGNKIVELCSRKPDDSIDSLSKKAKELIR